MKRMTAIALALLATGCQDLGLPFNTPVEETRLSPPSELVAAIYARTDEPTLVAEGRQWVPTGRPAALRSDELHPIGSVMGHTVYARSWDERPYDALYARIEAEADPLTVQPAAWQTYSPVLGGGHRSASDDGSAH